MLFAYLISIVATQFGPITSYNTFQMSKHVHAEYLTSEGGECTIALSIQRNADEKAVSWKTFSPTTEEGIPTQILVNKWNAPIVTDSVEPGIIVTDDDVASGINLASRASYPIVTDSRRFTYSVTLDILNRSGARSTETTRVYCDRDLCNCSTKGYPEPRW